LVQVCEEGPEPGPIVAMGAGLAVGAAAVAMGLDEVHEPCLNTFGRQVPHLDVTTGGDEAVRGPRR
jgi:hypothetical protein